VASIVNAKRVRDFAKASGRPAKTDRVRTATPYSLRYNGC
jgi:hypothetical protein